VKEHHPDRNNGSKESEAMLLKVNEAYDALKDGPKRTAYDTNRPSPHFRNAAQQPIRSKAERVNAVNSMLRDITNSYNSYIERLGSLELDTKRAEIAYKERFPGLTNVFKRMSYNTDNRSKAYQYLKIFKATGNRLEDARMRAEIVGITEQLADIARTPGKDVDFDAAKRVCADIKTKLDTRHGLLDNCFELIRGENVKMRYSYN